MDNGKSDIGIINEGSILIEIQSIVAHDDISLHSLRRITMLESILIPVFNPFKFSLDSLKSSSSYINLFLKIQYVSSFDTLL